MQTITYIKDGKERKISRLRYALLGKDDVYSIEQDSMEKLEYQVSENIELLHLRNFKFADWSCIHLYKDTILILDNCCFSNRFDIYNGSVSVNTPTYNTSRSNMYFHDNEYVELNLQDDAIEHIKKDRYQSYTYCLDKVQKLKMTGDVSKTVVDGEDEIISEVIMKDLKNPIFGSAYVDDMKIINTEIEYGCLRNVDYKKMYIENSILSTSGNILNFKNGKNIQIKDSIIGSPRIVLPNGITYEGMRELEFSSTNKNASGNLLSSRLSLISCLKTIGMQAENICDDKREEIVVEKDKEYNPQIDAHKKEIEKYAELIVEQEAAIANIEKERSYVKNNIDKSLKKQKIGVVVPTGINRK